jgi:chloramphenicol-sensitive protein RarD
LRPLQWVSIGMAAAAVIYLTIAHGSLPWIALTLASSFAVYGLLKKVAPLGALHGLALETGILFLPALAFLLYWEGTGQGAFLQQGMLTTLLLVGSGAVTSVPLLFFAAAARRVPLSLMGILQYVSPTLQFLLGALVYGEPFLPPQWIGFGIVWAALILFGVESAYTRRVQIVVAEAE